MIPPIASRFVAGETAAEAIEHAETLNERGVHAIVNRLGEHYETRAPADEDADAYIGLVDDVADSGLSACVSVKPSQIGLSVSDDAFAENAARIVEHAEGRDVFVWFDMEDHETTDATLDVYEDMASVYPGGVGVCVQANLKRTMGDLERLADIDGKVRLVKGAYDEPRSIAYKDKARVNEAFRECIAYCFEHFDDGVAIGSHDPAMIEYAKELHAEHGTGFEVQMLMGVREDAQFELADEYEMWQYVPYGDKWMSYFYRRAMERKENLLFAVRAVLGF